MGKTSRKHTWIIRLMIPAVIILSAALLYGQGGEANNKAAVEAEANANITDSAAVNIDSIYAVINIGFTQLEPIFKKGCFDCHSDKTDFPWYYKIPGIKQMINSDIEHARKHIDMSNGFPFGGHDSQLDKLQGIKDEIKEGEMPPLMYRMMHWSAKPTKEEAQSVYQWIDKSMEMLSPGSSTAPPEKHDEHDEKM